MSKSEQNITYSFTNEQFEALLDDRKTMLERLDQALSVNGELQQQLQAISAGLLHYDQRQVAELFSCSTKQLQRYAKDGKLVPRKLFGKTLYSADMLLEFLSIHDHPESIAEQIRQRMESAQPARRRRRTSQTGPLPTASPR